MLLNTIGSNERSVIHDRSGKKISQIVEGDAYSVTPGRYSKQEGNAIIVSHSHPIKNKENKIHSQYGDTFSIGGACYPEGHLESRSLTQDLLNLKTKVDSGADYLISQLFFDNEVFYNFLDQSQKIGINVPIIAGIMPVINSRQIQNIITLSGSSMPKKFIRILDKYKDDPAALKEAGTMYAIDQIIDLVTNLYLK